MKINLSLKYISFLFAILIAMSCSSSRRAIAVEEGWDLLSETKANNIRETDVVKITSRSLYTTLRFKVEKRDIKLSNLKIYFDNGDKLEPLLDYLIPAGQSSKYIEIGKQGRYIDRVEFKYRSVGGLFSKKADILLFGKRYYQPLQ